ncbi:MAG TPA: hypothetical protein VF662_07950 [Allosphingosinicella sp.]
MIEVVTNLLLLSGAPSGATANDGVHPFSASVVVGKLDEGFYSRFLRATSARSPVVVASEGGSAEVALKVAEVIKERRPEIVIMGICVSACAEILLPAAQTYAKSLILRDALIGFHHNSAIARQLYLDGKRRDFGHCYGALDAKFQQFRARTSMKYDAFRKQMSILRPKLVEGDGATACRQVRIVSEVKFWFPNSKQLSEDFGLRPVTGVCVDNSDCVARLLRMVAKNAEHYVIGDTEYSVQLDAGKFSLKPVS